MGKQGILRRSQEIGVSQGRPGGVKRTVGKAVTGDGWDRKCHGRKSKEQNKSKIKISTGYESHVSIHLGSY
jgi:hypothetical protein